MKSKEWITSKTEEVVMDLVNFFGPEAEYRLYMKHIVSGALQDAAGAKKPDELQLEKAFEDAFAAYKIKNPNYGVRDIVVFELAFFEAIRYIIKYKGE